MNRKKIVSGSLHTPKKWLEYSNAYTHTKKKSTMNVQSKNAMSVQVLHASVSVQRDGLCFVCLAQFKPKEA